MHMNDPSYLISTVSTLVHSLQTHHSLLVHDLLDAYATFTNRVTSHAHFLLTCDAPPPAIASLRIHKDDFIRALRRDVRAHTDTLSSPDQTSSENGTKIVSKQLTMDSSHHALYALTTIFRFPVFYSIFTEHDLSTLFGDLLDILQASYLSVFNQTQARSLSLCALSCHRLSPAVISFRQDDIFSVLQRSLDNTRQPVNTVIDGLKAVSHTIQQHPSAFLYLLSPLLPHVMTNLFSESPDLCLHACTALASFANALVLQPGLSLVNWHTLSNRIISFLDSYCNEFQADAEDTDFSRVIRAAFSAGSHTSGLAPTWIHALLASLIILCGPTLYEEPKVLRSILRSLAMVLKHKRSVIRALHPHVWRCFVWTLSQMLLSAENTEQAVISFAFHVIKQEVGAGIGVALVNLFLSDRISEARPDERGERVSQALSVIEEMVQTECKHTRREGFMFLQAFTGDTQVRHQATRNTHEIPATILLNGAIIVAEWDSLPLIIRSIPKVSPSVIWPRVTEIAQHHKTLLMIWKWFAIKADKEELDSNLVNVWQSILLVWLHELEWGRSALTAESLKFLAVTITEFLPPVPSGSRPDWGSWSIHDQLCRLTFINELWSTMRHVFIVLNLEEAAELILISILKYAFRVLDLGVRELWARLCASLMVAASPSFLRDLDDLAAPQLIIRSQRELWGTIATSSSSFRLELKLDWKALVKLLAIPICSWVLSSPELEAWKALLRNAITISGCSPTVTEVLQYLEEKEVANWESIMPVLGFLLSSTREHGNAPSDKFLSTLSVCLTASYTQARHSLEVLRHSLEMLSTIRSAMVSAPSEVMHVLRALDSSLCLWIEDRAEVMSDDEFNSVAVPLYCETLKTLEGLPLSVQSLRVLEHFLASAFSRIPTPAIAPFAFEKYWRATYYGHNQFLGSLPPKIKSCLTCFVAAYGGDLTDGLSLTTESQSQSTNDDSQAGLPVNRSHQFPGEFRLWNGSTPILEHAEAQSEVIDMEAVPHGHRQIFTNQEDGTFLLSSLDNDAFRTTILGQPQERPSPDASLVGGSEHSTRKSGIRVSSVSPPKRAPPSSHSLGKSRSHLAKQERNFQEKNAPQKQSRTSRALRATRELKSEPATRGVTPANVPCISSVLLKKKMVFDGVHLPTIRTVQEMAQKVETNEHTINTEHGRVVVPRAPSPRIARRSTRSPSSVPPSAASDEDNFDWEDVRVDMTSSEIDVDQFLEDPYPSSPFRVPTPTPHASLLSGLGLQGVVSQGDVSPPASTRPSLKMAQTTSARLDALRDVYSAVANEASQIPMSELVQATRLVHQIGAVLTDRIGKTMRDQGSK